MDTFNQCMYINETNEIFGLYDRRERERELLYKTRLNDFLTVNKLKCGDYYS